MRALYASLALLALPVTIACRPSSSARNDRALADTTSTKTPALAPAPSDTAAATQAAPQGGSAASATGSRMTVRSSSTTKSTASSTGSRANRASPDSGILGRDSIIRFPHRTLPTASSTSTRR